MAGNRVRQAFAEKRCAFGIFIMVPSPALVEIAGYVGFDFVVLDMEHGALGPESLEQMIRAAEVAGTSPIVRVTVNDRGLILRALDAGALGVLVPHVASVQAAQAAVSASKYPPEGFRGLSTTSRAGRHSLRGVRDHIEWSNREVLVAVQIEDAAALPEVDAIAAVPGIDVLFVGPSDLALSLGHPGQVDHPAVEEAIGRIFEAAKKSQREVGYFVRDVTGGKRMRDRGVRFLTFNSTLAMAQAFQELIRGIQERA